jgi:hypothetical protein
MATGKATRWDLAGIIAPPMALPSRMTDGIAITANPAASIKIALTAAPEKLSTRTRRVARVSFDGSREHGFFR